MKQGHGINSIIKMHPFPHSIIDNYLNPSLLRQAHKEMENYRHWGHDNTAYSASHQVNKVFTPWCQENLKDLERDCPLTWGILQYLNSPSHISSLSSFTSIPNLLPDPTFAGGGIHRISQGGKLDVHADYNFHPTTKLHRRLNLLVYFTPNWNTDWGGELELWKRDGSEMAISISPQFNRAVCFEISDDAFHGHPHPLKTPPHIHRYSMALYYFTKERPVHEITAPHAALWKPANPSIQSIFEV